MLSFSCHFSIFSLLFQRYFYFVIQVADTEIWMHRFLVIPARDAGIQEYKKSEQKFLKKNKKKYLH
jgi:hypothetical protein